MRTLYLLLALVAALLVAVATLNWEVFITPTDISLGFGQVAVPLNLMLLGLLVLLSVLFLVHAVYIQGSALMETRRHTKELLANRDLADKAEASRFTDLRAHLDREVAKLSEVINTQSRETLSRVDRAEMGLRERPADAEISRLVQAVENHNRDLHSRVDRLEMGLREGLAGYTPAPASVTASTHASLAAPPRDDVGDVVPS